MAAFEASVEKTIARWHGIEAPNKPAKQMLGDLPGIIAAFEALRGTLVFEDEPSSFEAALQATKEAGP